MLAAILSIALSTPRLPPPDDQAQDPAEAASAADSSVVVVDCAIADKALADCKVVNAVSDDRSATALKMALTLKVPDEVLDAGVSHVRLRLRIPGGTTAALPPPAMP